MAWEIGMTCQSDQAHLQCGNGSVSSQQSSILALSLGWEALSPAPQMECGFPWFHYLSFICFLPTFLAKRSSGMAWPLTMSTVPSRSMLFQSYATESHDNLSKLSTLFLSFPSLAPHGARRAGQRLGAAMPGTGSLTGRSAKKNKKL